ncbi:related to SLD3-Interacts with Cdc45 and functions for chromosomal DNA replication [Zygosaccharomyces bailii ISA1307]|uniref:BN860_12574g1_1 n=1 Tax=Zygosaccharomyces bailii (strain CLIB 213 / ATCC 58445 / CBS 680 / BCRC 21525 / NBRC 1098 / NCYC 1416 / NRRL Y-2227) TaxID=1333698 RepID=A0A8J2T438_ZYGB2|nr:BN860_12574g1_1 [Zygosaccharomyces bailii CLIB 213]CDH14586.1 related to SLD3-Interacts with Cdc45 and functions for chromosomal DNA replication [Zygosaccharomyces bailii ISA1307]
MATWRLLASFKLLPKSLSLDHEKVQVLAHDSILRVVLPESRANKTGLKHLLQGAEKYQLLERYGNLFWICWDVIGIDLQDVHDDFVGDEHSVNWMALKEWNQLNLKELLPLWKEDDSSHTVHETSKLHMKPPGGAASSQDVIRVDPRTYLETKYCDSLFNIRLPLAYFVKSNLSRLKNACNSNFNDGNAYLTIILKKLLSISEFDKRHANEGLLRVDLDGIQAERRKSCLAKCGIRISEGLQQEMSSLKELPAILKIREIKLQIIILLETIDHNKLDGNFENFETRYQCKLRRRSLNLTKRRALPMKSSLTKLRSDNNANNKAPIQLDYCEQLDLYLDKLCILDILLASEAISTENDNMDAILEHKKNILNKNKEASSMGFTNYVLIPYFAKKVPNTIRFTIQKLKGPSLRGRKNSERNITPQPPTNISENTKLDPPIDLGMNSSASSPQFTTNSSWCRNNSAMTTPKMSNIRTISNANVLLDSNPTLLKKPTFIARTKSDLTMNLMRKRQLSVTEFSSYDQKVPSNDQFEKSDNSTCSLRLSQQRSFRRVGKRKSERDITDTNHDLAGTSNSSETIQVMGTPLVKISNDTPRNRAKLQNIVESPMGQLPSMRTPSNNRISECTGSASAVRPEEICAANKAKKNIKRRLFAP